MRTNCMEARLVQLRDELFLGRRLCISIDIWRRIITVRDISDKDSPTERLAQCRSAARFLRRLQIVLDRTANIGDFGNGVRKVVRFDSTRIIIDLDGSDLKSGGDNANW